MKLASLPKWVVDDAESVRQECAPYIAMTGQERMAVLAALLRDAERILAARADSDRARAWSDPLPASTVRALERLRAEAKSKGRR
jgi:hypothetical protein